jgi:hypothetical protein
MLHMNQVDQIKELQRQGLGSREIASRLNLVAMRLLDPPRSDTRAVPARKRIGRASIFLNPDRHAADRGSIRLPRWSRWRGRDSTSYRRWILLTFGRLRRRVS